MQSRYAQIFSQLESERQNLERRLNGLSDQQLRQPLGEGKWSALQTVRHLIMAEERSVAYLRKKLEFPEGVQKANWKSRFRGALLLGWFKLGLKAKAPGNLGDVEPNQDKDQLYRDYTAVRQLLSDTLERIPEDWRDLELFKHPVAGRMRLEDALSFLQAHFRHHRKQLDQLFS